MNTNDYLLWKKTKFVNGKRNATKFMFNKEDTEIFIQNWENNVFARSDIKDTNIEITEQRDKKLDRLYKKFKYKEF